MSKPHLGVPLPEGLDWVCGYSGPTPRAGEPTCLRDAAWHGFVLNDTHTSVIAMMSCCDQHRPHMALTADYVHPLVHPCGIPGSRFRWPENECYIEWSERELLDETALASIEARL